MWNVAVMRVYHERIVATMRLQQSVGVNHIVFTAQKKDKRTLSQNATEYICRHNYCTKKIISQTFACVPGKDKQVISWYL